MTRIGSQRQKKKVYYYKHVENQISVHKLSTGGDKWYPIILKVYFPNLFLDSNNVLKPKCRSIQVLADVRLCTSDWGIPFLSYTEKPGSNRDTFDLYSEVVELESRPGFMTESLQAFHQSKRQLSV
jgi:hypothetical protein